MSNQDQKAPNDPGARALRRALETADIRPTRQRMIIASIMLEKPQHLSADQVMALANRRDRWVSKATVYNTLSLFARKGLLREVIVDPTRVFYDSNTSHHHHLFDVEHGTLTDLPADQVRRVVRGLACHPAPGARPHLVGLAQFGGEPLAVLDLHALVTGGTPRSDHRATVILGRQGAWSGAVLGLAPGEAVLREPGENLGQARIVVDRETGALRRSKRGDVSTRRGLGRADGARDLR